MLPLGTICTSAATFVSQNYGAGKKERIKQGISASVFLGTIWSVLVLMIVLAAGKQLIYTLTGSTDADVIGISMKYLYWNVPFYGALLLSRMIGYLGICLTEPITWFICVPIVLAGFIQKLKQISKI